MQRADRKRKSGFMKSGHRSFRAQILLSTVKLKVLKTDWNLWGAEEPIVPISSKCKISYGKMVTWGWDL